MISPNDLSMRLSVDKKDRCPMLSFDLPRHFGAIWASILDRHAFRNLVCGMLFEKFGRVFGNHMFWGKLWVRNIEGNIKALPR